MIGLNQTLPLATNDPDEDWLALAEVIPAHSFREQPKRALFIPSFTLTFLQQLLPAKDAIPILLVAMAEMRMRNTRETPLGPKLWQRVGSPSRRVRSRWLEQIQQLPATLCSLTPRKGRPHLLTQGKDWPQPMHVTNVTLNSQ